MKLTFRPVDLIKDKDLCISFRIDSYVESFGNADLFYKEYGEQGEQYISSLQKRMEFDPNYVVHVLDGNKIIGQIEMAPYKDDPEKVGYVNLYYLIPEVRGKGYAKFLDEYTMNFLTSKGFLKAVLSVTPTNRRAVKFYLKNGWKDLGERPGHPELHIMEKDL